MKDLGDRMAAATGYTSQYSWQLYDTAGTTEDDTYAATGGYGYTIEIGPSGGLFHMAYDTGVASKCAGWRVLPTGTLDRLNGERVLEVLRAASEQHGTALVVATHDLDLASRFPIQVSITDGRLAA